ncbi:14892_t:CDS:2, partial [Dentiscutata heterogama]
MNLSVYGSLTTKASIAIMSFTVAVVGQLLDKQRKERIADASKRGQNKGPQPTIPELNDGYPPQYNDPPPKTAFNPSEYPPDKLNYNVAAAEQQGYYVRSPNIYQQQRDSINSDPVRDSSSAPLFHNYNSSRRESISSAAGQVYNERSTSPAFNPRQYSTPTPPPHIRQVNQPPYMQQSSQQLYQARSPRLHNVAGPQSSMSSPI